MAAKAKEEATWLASEGGATPVMIGLGAGVTGQTSFTINVIPSQTVIPGWRAVPSKSTTPFEVVTGKDVPLTTTVPALRTTVEQVFEDQAKATARVKQKMSTVRSIGFLFSPFSFF